MATNQQKILYQHLTEALSRVEGFLHRVAEFGGSQEFRGEAEANLRACRTLRQMAQSTVAEAEQGANA